LNLAETIDELIEAHDSGSLPDGTVVTIQKWRRGDEEWSEWYVGEPVAAARCPDCGAVLPESAQLVGMWSLTYPHVDQRKVAV
jgi:hypothetical protein